MLSTYGPSYGAYDPWQIQVFPLFNGPVNRATGQRGPDWSVNYTLPGLQVMNFQNSLDSLIDVLTKLREEAAA